MRSLLTVFSAFVLAWVACSKGQSLDSKWADILPSCLTSQTGLRVSHEASYTSTYRPAGAPKPAARKHTRTCERDGVTVILTASEFLSVKAAQDDYFSAHVIFFTGGKSEFGVQEEYVRDRFLSNSKRPFEGIDSVREGIVNEFFVVSGISYMDDEGRVSDLFHPEEMYEDVYFRIGRITAEVEFRRTEDIDCTFISVMSDPPILCTLGEVDMRIMESFYTRLADHLDFR